MLEKLLSFFLIVLPSLSFELNNYEEARKELIHKNESLSFSHLLSLSPEEKEVSLSLERMKQELFLLYGTNFPPSQNFLCQKKAIQENTLYTFLRKMPKGGLLHVHSGALAPTSWVIEELTTLPNCHIYWQEDGAYLKGTLYFYPEGKAPLGFIPIQELRNSIDRFDEMLLSLLQINPGSTQPWKDFEEYFSRLKGVIHYKEAFSKYYLKALEGLYEDHIQHMEIRSLKGFLYDLTEEIKDPKAIIEAFLSVQKKFRETHPDFDFRLIYANHRTASSDEERLIELEEAYQLRALYPDFIIGYDLVGQEDAGNSSLSYVKPLFEAEAFCKIYGVDLPYYFHDGESLRADNENLYEAILLKCKRIGHALNLFFFPYLQEEIIKNNICLEICPISNQVLGYVSDLRLHPAAGYLKAGIPCIISSDDPACFGYEGVSCDLWEAVMAWDLTLKDLKQLFLNSILYSGLSEENKKKALTLFQSNWDAFIEKEALKN